MQNNFSKCREWVPRGTSQHKWRWLTTLLLILTLGIGQMWADSGLISAASATDLGSGNTPRYVVNVTGVGRLMKNATGSNSWAASNGYLQTGSSKFALQTYNEISSIVITGYGTGNNRTFSSMRVGTTTSNYAAASATGSGTMSSTATNQTITITPASNIAADSYVEITLSGNINIASVELVYASSGGEDPVSVTGITLAPSSATIKVGRTLTLVPTITPNDATDKAVTWAVTSGSTYASVTDAGVVTGLAAGTAVVTATAHDGSGITQTATITVEECAASGTMYKFQVKTGLENGNIATSVPSDIPATTENYLSALTGGSLTIAARSNVNRVQIVNASAIGFSNGADAYLEMKLDCDVEAGDIIKYTIASNNMELMAGSATESTNKMTLDRTKSQVVVDSKLVGASSLYMKRSSSSPNISYFEIFRPVYRTITLNYNDGVTANGSIQVIDGEAATKPADPTRGKYTFLGWFVGDTDDEYVWSSTVNGNITLKAHWQDPWTITFDANGGSAVDAITVKHNTKADKPEDPTLASNEFDGWFIGDTDTPFDWDANVTANYSLKAHWLPIVAKYDIEYYDGETKIGTEAQVRVDQHPTATGIETYKPLMTFGGWFLSSALTGDPVDLNTVTPSEGLKIYGKWTKAYGNNVDFEAYILANTGEKDDADKAEAYVKSQNYALSTKTNTTFDANNSTNNGAYAGLKIKNSGTVLSWNVAAGKVVEFKAGVMVANGSLAINGGAATTIDGGTTGTGDNFKIHYFYNAAEALYTFTTSNGNAEVVKAITMRDPYTVSYDPHGADAIDAQNATPSVTLPTPVNGTGNFKGWYDAETEGNKIGNAGAEYMPTANITLHAQWEIVSSDNTLSDLQVDGATVAGFDPAVQIYNLVYEYGQQPVITSATATAGALATVTINNTPVEEATFKYVQVKVEAESGAERFYQVRYTNNPKQGATIFKAELTSNTAADYSGMYADGDNSEIKLANDGANGYKFSGTSNYVKMAIADATFAEGDMLKMTYTTNPQQGELAIYDGTTKLQGTAYSNHILTFSDAADGKSTLFIRRTSDNNFNGWVAEVEVQRYMAPIIKSFKIGAVAGTIDQDLKTIAIELPYGTSLYGVAATIEAYANGGATVTAPTILAYDTPLGFKVSSAYAEDGDVDYTLTITEADHYEAMIVGGANYETLAAAVAAAQADDVVKLLDNVDLMATGLTIAENITLDLNGFNIKAGEQIDNDIVVPAGKKLTLVDNSANAEGKIYTEQAYTGAVTGYGLVRVAGELLMQSGNIYAVIESDPANLGQFAVVLGAGGKATIEGGQIKAGWYAISNNGNNTGSTIIVSGGELISTADFAIYNPAKESTVTVSGGVVYGAAGGIAMNRGELTVTGGTITSKDQGSTGTWGDGTGGLSNAAISASGKYESVEVEISGGTIIAEGTAVMITNGTTNPVEVAISGGQFSHVVPAEYCAAGFAPVTEPNAQGKYEVEDKRIYIFDGSTMSNMATSPSGAISWAKVGDVMSATDKSGTYDEVNYTKALQLGNSTTTKHFKIDVALNNAAKIEVIGMSNSSSGTRHAWLTNSTDKGEIANAIASLESDGYNPEYFATDWLEEGSYYLHADNTVNIFLVRVTSKEVDPKCEQPTITTQPATDLTFGAGNMTATVVAEVSDEGTLTYQWYNAANDEAVVGQTTATLTTADEGTYYVIVTNTKASHRDNSIKSDEAQLAHRVLNDATLSALGYGDPATAIALEADKYDYRVDLAMGTIDVPELTATATMAPYPVVSITNATEFVNYEATSTVLVTAEDGITQKTYTVKFVVDHVYTTLVDVTESTTWNWTGSDDVTINDVANKGLILANYIDGLNFEKIEGKEGERARRNQNGGVYQGTHLHFNTTVAGKVKFYFRAPSSGENCTITVKNNGKEMVAGTRGNSFGWSKEIVVKGDVVIEMVNDKEGGGDTRVQQIVFTEVTPDYTRNVTNNIGTLCVDHNVLVGGAMGATFYQIASRNEQYNDKIDFEEVLPNEELKAGEPYIFKSTTGKIELYYGETEADAPVAVRGMIGSFVDAHVDITSENMSDILYIANNRLWNCEDMVGGYLDVVANRAYIVMSDVPTYADYQAAQTSNPAPRRRVTLGKDAEQTATGLENLVGGEQAQKLMIDGQMYILRGEKLYDATGRLVK